VPGFAYHLISRFIENQWFIVTEHERTLYLRLLGRALSSSDWKCLAYGAMSSHIHLGMIAGEQPLHSWLRRVHSPFATAINKSLDRIGPVFVRGPADHYVAPQRVCKLIAYIHNNPTRAGVVNAARASSWTSHRAYIGLERAPPWLHVPEGLARAGFTGPAEFDRWVTEPASSLRRQDLVDVELQGGEATPTRRRRTIDCPTPDAIVQATAEVVGVSLPQLRSSRRGSHERLARRIAVQCAAIVGLTGVEIATALAITQQGESVIRRRGLEGDSESATCTRVLRRLKAA
jgi:hypothetical protein